MKHRIPGLIALIILFYVTYYFFYLLFIISVRLLSIIILPSLIDNHLIKIWQIVISCPPRFTRLDLNRISPRFLRIES